MEKGKIEQPLKPVIRIGTPVFDKANKKQGILLLNVLADSLIHSYTEAMSNKGKRSWLVNSDGYWLKGPTPELEWGFMYQSNEASMQYLYSAAWEKIKSLESGSIFVESGLWTFSTIYPLVEGQKSSTGSSEAFQASRSDIETYEYYWKAILFLPKESYQAKIWFKVTWILFALIVVLVVIFIGCWFLAQLWVKHLRAEQKVLRISKGLEEEVKTRTKELNLAREIAEQEARTDELTGMNNRRAFFEFGSQIQKLSERYRHKYSLLMLDLDHFKKINDSFAHAAGDKVLKEVARVISKLVRGADVAARVGGEEFAIILPEAESSESFQLAERIRQTIEANIIEVGSQNQLSITVSIGLAESQSNICAIEKIMSMADSALYQAKNNGRNCVHMYSSAMLK